MITQGQIENLAQDFKIDKFTIFREYLQLVFLSYLYQNKKANKIYFKGGTAIHLLLGSPRFSEDLDFGTGYERKKIKEIIGEIKNQIKRELPEVEISLLYQGKKSLRFRFKYQLLGFKYPFSVRLDFTQKEKPKKTVTSPLVTRFPLVFFPLVPHLSFEEILAEKVRAFLIRGKGRDLFDLWFLLEKGIKIDYFLVEQKLKEVGRKFKRELFLKKIKNYPFKNLKSDLAKFLPQSQREIIGILKDILLKKMEKDVLRRGRTNSPNRWKFGNYC